MEDPIRFDNLVSFRTPDELTDLRILPAGRTIAYPQRRSPHAAALLLCLVRHDPADPPLRRRTPPKSFAEGHGPAPSRPAAPSTTPSTKA
jgi:hypothetical protein